MLLTRDSDISKIQSQFSKRLQSSCEGWGGDEIRPAMGFMRPCVSARWPMDLTWEEKETVLGDRGCLDLPLPFQHQLSHPENYFSLERGSGEQLKKAFHSCQGNSAKIWNVLLELFCKQDSFLQAWWVSVSAQGRLFCESTRQRKSVCRAKPPSWLTWGHGQLHCPSLLLSPGMSEAQPRETWYLKSFPWSWGIPPHGNHKPHCSKCLSNSAQRQSRIHLREPSPHPLEICQHLGRRGLFLSGLTPNTGLSCCS